MPETVVAPAHGSMDFIPIILRLKVTDFTRKARNKTYGNFLFLHKRQMRKLSQRHSDSYLLQQLLKVNECYYAINMILLLLSSYFNGLLILFSLLWSQRVGPNRLTENMGKAVSYFV